MYHNKEAEKAVLGCMILENNLIQKVCGHLTEEDFFFGQHRTLFNEIVTRYAKKEAVDVATLTSLPIHEVAGMLEKVMTTANINRMIAEVKTKSKKRNLNSEIQKFKEILENDMEELGDLKAELMSMANSIDTETDTKPCNIAEIMVESINTLEQQYVQGKQMFKNFGIEWLDQKTGGMKPGLTILAARPSVGKSAFALQVATSIARQGGKVAFFGLEMPNEQNAFRMLSNYGAISKDFFDKPWTMTNEAWAQAGQAAGKISSFNFKMFDRIFNIDQIISKCSEIKAEHGLDFVVIDYLQLIETPKQFKTTNDKVSYISRNLKKFQQTNGIHLMALSQLNRETERQEFPTLSNLRDSGSLEQDADNVWFLHPEKEDLSENKNKDHVIINLILAKQRSADRGLMKKVKFYGKTQRFFQD